MPGPRPGITYICDGSWSAAPAADRPSVDALRVQHVLGHADLLLTARTGRGTRPTVGVPRAHRELQAAGEAVTGVDRPVATRLALRDGIPVHAVRRVNRRRRRGVRRGGLRSVRVVAHGSGRRGRVRSRRRGRVRGGPGWVNVRVKAHRVRAGGRRWHARERPGDRGEYERLTAVLQISSFRGARAEANPQGGLEVLGSCGTVALGRAV